MAVVPHLPGAPATQRTEQNLEDKRQRGGDAGDGTCLNSEESTSG